MVNEYWLVRWTDSSGKLYYLTAIGDWGDRIRAHRFSNKKQARLKVKIAKKWGHLRVKVIHVTTRRVGDLVPQREAELQADLFTIAHAIGYSDVPWDVSAIVEEINRLRVIEDRGPMNVDEAAARAVRMHRDAVEAAAEQGRDAAIERVCAAVAVTPLTGSYATDRVWIGRVPIGSFGDGECFASRIRDEIRKAAKG